MVSPKQQVPVHVIDIITNYFAKLDIDAKNFNIKTWLKISEDLLNLVNINQDKIQEMKNKHKDATFIYSYYNDFLVNYSNRTVEDRTVIENNNITSVYLNTAYSKSIINSNKMSFNLLYPKIFSSLWINDIITFNNENLGIIIYNITHNYYNISSILISLEKQHVLKAYLNFVYGIYHSGKLDIKKQDLVKIDGVEYNDTIRAYAYYMYTKMRKYIGDYMIYYDTDIFFYLNANEPHLEDFQISTFISNTFGAEFSHEFEFDIDSLFLEKRKYLYINQRGKLKLVGIKRIDPNDKNNITKLTRKAKIREVFE